METRMNEPAAAKYMRIPLHTLRRMRKEEAAPTHIVVNRRPYYEQEDLDRFLKSVTVEAQK